MFLMFQHLRGILDNLVFNYYVPIKNLIMNN